VGSPEPQRKSDSPDLNRLPDSNLKLIVPTLKFKIAISAF